MNEHSFKTTFCGTFQFYVIEKKMVDGKFDKCHMCANCYKSKQQATSQLHTPGQALERADMQNTSVLKICNEAPMFMHM